MRAPLPLTRISGRVVLAALLLPIGLLAQRYSFREFGPADGLTNLSVNSLLQDQLGFIWVGTTNGLFRYDGAQFQSFRHAEGVPSNQIKALHETPDGAIWVGTRRGLAVRRKGRFQTVTADGGLESNYAQNISSDPTGRLYVISRGVLWVGRWDAPQPDFRALDVPGLGQDPRSAALIRDSKGRVWLTCGTAVCRMDGQTVEVFSTGSGLPADNWRSLWPDRNGGIYVRSPTMLYQWSVETGRFSLIRRQPPGPEIEIPVISTDPEGHLLLTTHDGLLAQDPDGWSAVGESQGLPAGPPSFLLWSREGILWMGMGDHGLALWRGYRQWESWTHADGLITNAVTSVQRNGAGTLFVGTQSGVNIRKPGSSTWEVWRPMEELRDLSIRTIAGTPDGSVWIGSGLGSLVRTKANGDSVRIGPENGLENDRIISLSPDKSGVLWVCSREGVFRGVSPANDKFERVPVPVTRDENVIYRVLTDPQGVTWMAGTAGLYRSNHGRWTLFTDRDGLRHRRLSFLAYDGQGAVWVGYDEMLGVSRLRIRGDHISASHFTSENSLRSDNISFIESDSRGWVWIGTDNGVSVFDGQSWRNLSEQDGLIGQDCNFGSFFEDRDGSIWIGSSSGVSHLLTPDRIAKSLPPPVALTEISYGIRASDPAAAPAQAASNAGPLKITFSGLAYVNPGELRFRYRLRGLSDEWIETSQREVSYTNLLPGNYRFEVESRRPQDDWQGSPAVYEFEILPAWWQAVWGRLLGLFLAVLAGYFIWHLRLRRLLDQRSELETAVQSRTEEIQLGKYQVEEQKREIERLLEEAKQANQLKSEFLANISHEIRTPMNGILGMTELALAAAVSPEQKQYLEMAQVSGWSLLQLLSDVLDLSKIEAGRLDLECRPFSVRDCMSQAIQTLSPLATAKCLALSLQIDGGIPELVVGDDTRLRQIFLNLVSNAVKFTEIGGVEVRAALNASSGDDITLQCSVADTGIGISPEKQGLIFDRFRQADGSTSRKYGGTGLGLAISAKLARLMGGHIWLESEEGVGSTFYFLIHVGVATPKSASTPPQPAAQPVRDESGQTILLVEDNPISRLLATRLLEKRGYRVVSAESGIQALDLFGVHQVSLVLMDMQMPEFDGLSTTGAIRELERDTGRHTPILIVTANAMKGDRERCLEAGADGYLTKPVQPQQLYEAIEQLIYDADPPAVLPLRNASPSSAS